MSCFRNVALNRNDCLRVLEKNKVKLFTNLVFQRKINAAMNLLSDSNAGVHRVDENILYELRQKYPQSAPLNPETLLSGSK